jgi:2-iminobutanoate/2-iminopropanoate deaminase
MQRLYLILIAAVLLAGFAPAREESPNGVKTLDPPGAIKAVGTWSLGARAGDFIFVAGMQGVDPATNKLEDRRPAFARPSSTSRRSGNPKARASRIASG